jgi:hypothetical protein
MLLILTDTIFTPPNSKPQWFEVDRAATHNSWEAVELSTAALGEDSLHQDEPRLMSISRSLTLKQAAECG